MKTQSPDYTTVRGIILLALTISGCGSDPLQTQVCHVGEDSTSQVIGVKSERELGEHLGHGDAVFGVGLAEDCTGAVTFRVNADIELSQESLAGLRGGPPRRVAALMGPDGSTDEYIVDELDVRFKEEQEGELEAFLQRYDATILRDDVALVADDDGQLYEAPGGMNGWRLVRIETSTSGLVDLPKRAVEAGYEGELSFSSDEALRTFAAFLRERAHKAAPNRVTQPHALIEHPDDVGGNIDMADRWWMRDDDDPSVPGDQGLSVGVARAFEYLRHVGLPAQNGVAWEPARIAIIDQGFDLDEESGVGNADYNTRPGSTAPMQVDLIDFDGTAGGPIPNLTGKLKWHGQLAFGVASAYPRNAFGGAGTGGEYTRPILIRMSGTTADMAASVRTAYLMGADVINISWGGQCNTLCDLKEGFSDGHLQEEITTATVWGASIFAAAGNGPDNRTNDYNMDGEAWFPCELNGVICVGAVNRSGDNEWNWGANVDIWAPTDVRSTVAPTSAGADGNDIGIDEVSLMGGTSCASPFAAGIAGLLKTLRPEMRWEEVQSILQATSNPSSDPMVSVGYVDALRAVQAAYDNPPPTVVMRGPRDGATPSWGSPIRFNALAYDPADIRLGFRGMVEFHSDVDGLICTAPGDYQNCDGRLSTLGEHTVWAVAIDEFGSSASSEAISVVVVNHAPSVYMVSPQPGATLYGGQSVSFRATVYDQDGEDYSSFCSDSPDVACTDWISSLDGSLAPNNLGGNALSFTSPLSEGLHTITVTARDALGEVSSKSVTVAVVPGEGKPTANILTPVWDITWRSPILLKGRGSDPEDGVLFGGQLEWHSSVDGFLGYGTTIPVTLTGPECENTLNHTITLRVTDSDGNVGTDEMTVEFTNIC